MQNPLGYVIFCPYCEKEKRVQAGKYRCKSCYTEFSVDEKGDVTRIYNSEGKKVTAISLIAIGLVQIVLMVIFCQKWSAFNFLSIFMILLPVQNFFAFAYGYPMVLKYSTIEETKRTSNQIFRFLSLIVSIVLLDFGIYFLVLLLTGQEIVNNSYRH